MKTKLLGHPSTLSAIQNFVDTPGHCLEIIGKVGSGKSYIAEYIAALLLGIEKFENHPYIIRFDVRVDKAGIEQVRELQRQLSLQVPGRKKIRRVVIIDNFDIFGHEAQNAMLKTLEEPPVDTVILLTVSHKDTVLPTIHSRAQQISVLPVSESSAELFTKNEVSPATFKKAYSLSGGDAGLFLALLKNEQDHPLVLAINEAKTLLAGSKYDRLARVDKITKNKEVSVGTLVDALYRIIHATSQVALAKNDKQAVKLAHAKMKHIIQSVKDLDAGVSVKLILIRLFFNL